MMNESERRMFAYLLKPERYPHESYEDYRVRRISTNKMLKIRNKYGITAFDTMWRQGFQTMVRELPGVQDVLDGLQHTRPDNRTDSGTEGDLVSQGTGIPPTDEHNVLRLDSQEIKSDDSATGSSDSVSEGTTGDTPSL